MLPRIARSVPARRLAATKILARPAIRLQNRSASTQPEQNGEYPDVPFEWMQHRDKYLKYDDQQARRNFNEPVSREFDYGDVWSPDRFDQYSNKTAIIGNVIFFSAVAAFAGFCYVYLYPEPIATRRSYPYGGLYKALGASEEDKEVYQARVDEGN
ncbi:uncharacterized protein SAPINGB_P004467 [Magnusiomyces paraingens]|uniref:Uncharacterized protein n=1 Tax=Magnusiomyces paraingens TaxID=2606893 RepID=A0A5E8BZQ8_9ASCO|nr:uncharacterized protein SAPINGB_P004467 [Saprochaete ingens]VVT55180.1 unnamed protein product [Saprochaete ingens]